MRTKLPDRRRAMTEKVMHSMANGEVQEFLITFGIDDEGTIREVFCANPAPEKGKRSLTGSDMYAMLSDGCIMISLHLQTGAEIEKLVGSFSENRNEGETKGLPSSVFGSIARAILALQKEILQP